MTFRAYKYPQFVDFHSAAGGWMAHDILTDGRHFYTNDEMPEKVSAMEGAGWRFNDAREKGFPY